MPGTVIQPLLHGVSASLGSASALHVSDTLLPLVVSRCPQLHHAASAYALHRPRTSQRSNASSVGSLGNVS
ncbi:hypothetical protein Micbo1qcDRAFT_12131 [Microdochium bolleyi]|uniref:Uncharacterized protein n=1 Tax=Microdochium bolleyi TaxID=196109 RepID=A0A136IXB2_9PEZI|nr:hypothetical protein Micbo1qcDRAFT_12131 [Microdochium bolleyi]